MATRLGKPQILFCHQRLPTESQTDRLRRGEYCPIVWRLLMEQVDWCRFVVGCEPESVLSIQYDSSDSDFYQMVSLEFPKTPDGIRPVAQISLGHYIPGKWSDALSYRRPASMQVRCERGLAFVDLPNSLIWFDDAGQHTESLDSDRSVGELMLNQFHRAVTSLVRNRTDLVDAYRAMQIVIEANESVKSGHRRMIKFDSKNC